MTECSICLENIDNDDHGAHVTKCGHSFHKTCAEQLKESGHYKCPMCREVIFSSPSLSLFVQALLSQARSALLIPPHVIYIETIERPRTYFIGELPNIPDIVAPEMITLSVTIPNNRDGRNFIRNLNEEFNMAAENTN